MTKPRPWFRLRAGDSLPRQGGGVFDRFFGATILFVFLGGVACRQTAPTPSANASPTLAPPPYVLIGPQGATAFARLADAVQPDRSNSSAPDQATRIAAGFGFLVTEERAVAGRRYVHLHDGRWLAREDIAAVSPSTFTGLQIPSDAPLNVAWIVGGPATPRVSPSPDAPPRPALPERTAVTLRGRCDDALCETNRGWIARARLAIATTTPPPPSLDAARPDERWLDVDLTAQILVAYRRHRPVFATLISSGVGAPGSPFATPIGTFRILAKHAIIKMDNLEHTDVVPYSYDVPFAQYFKDNKAFHATFWHDRFGRPSSHGCVNLSPQDAAWLFTFTTPTLDAAATSATATTTHPGTLVRVRGDISRDSLP